MTVALHHQALGAGAPLVILHGLFGSGTNWRSIARHLAGTHRVWLVDLRNHGRSGHGARMDYASLAADVRALLDAEGLERPAVLGHSMGGKTAMRLALETPERVERLVVVDIAPRATGNDHGALVAALRAAPLATLHRRAEADAALAPSVPDPGLRGFLLQNLAGAPDGTLRWRLGLEAIAASMQALTGFPEPPPGARFEGPCLFVRGERSEYLLDTDLAPIRERFPRARMHTVPGAGHWVHAEQPHAFLEPVRAFLEPSNAG